MCAFMLTHRVFWSCRSSAATTCHSLHHQAHTCIILPSSYHHHLWHWTLRCSSGGLLFSSKCFFLAFPFKANNRERRQLFGGQRRCFISNLFNQSQGWEPAAAYSRPPFGGPPRHKYPARLDWLRLLLLGPKNFSFVPFKWS